MAFRWKYVLPIIGAVMAISAGRMVADWSTPDGRGVEPKK